MENLERAKKQTISEIMEAYLFLREKNMTIPSETLELMKDASIKEVNGINKELLGTLQKVLKELEYALHSVGSICISDYDKRQEIIDQNKIVIQARKAIQKALS